jgi:DNA polymerase III subunit beta
MPTDTAVRAICNRKALHEALQAVAPVVPARSPKPILQSVRFAADPDDGATLTATDLEVALTAKVLGVQAEAPFSVMLPHAKILQIVGAMPDEEIVLAIEDETLKITGLRAKFSIPTEDPDLFPEPPTQAENAPLTLTQEACAKIIKRCLPFCDLESTRYALGGVSFQFDGANLEAVATDGRRLSQLSIPVEVAAPLKPAVISAKTFKCLEKLVAKSDPQTPISICYPQEGWVQFAEQGSFTLNARLVEGRFPRWQDVFPPEAPTLRFPVGPDFLQSVLAAQTTTSDESRGIDVTIGRDEIELSAKAADVGSGYVRHPIQEITDLPDEGDFSFTADGRYLADMLRAAQTTPLTWEFRSHKHPVVCRADDGWNFVLMPLTRDR